MEGYVGLDPASRSIGGLRSRCSRHAGHRQKRTQSLAALVVLRRPSSVGGTLIPLSLDAEAEALAGVPRALAADELRASARTLG
jgi:hypothetical protein